jgi:protein-disulfide isomerase
MIPLLLIATLLAPFAAGAQRPAPAPATRAAGAGGAATAEPERDARLARADRGRVRGKNDAIWVVAISDFQCPFCKKWHEETLPLIERDYVRTGKVQLAYMNFPIASSHPNAPATHEFAMCAAEQGAFWPAADALFRTQRSWGARREIRSFLDSLGRGLPLDQRRLATCLASREMKVLVDADYTRATQIGVGSTPSFLIGGRPMVGAQPYEAFQRAIEAALADQGTATPTPKVNAPSSGAPRAP